MSDCHHIDWSGLQMVVKTPNGPLEPTFTCFLCDVVLDKDEYKELVDVIKQKKKDNVLDFWRTPKGKEHTLEDCPDEKKCDIHGDDS